MQNSANGWHSHSTRRSASSRTETGLCEAESRRLARRLRGLGKVNLSGREFSWDLELTTEERNEAERLLADADVQSPFIAMSLGAKLLVKDWTPENWESLLSGLSISYPGLAIVALGAEDEREKTDSVLAHWRGIAANLCGRTSPRVSAAVLEKASCLSVMIAVQCIWHQPSGRPAWRSSRRRVRLDNGSLVEIKTEFSSRKNFAAPVPSRIVVKSTTNAFCPSPWIKFVRKLNNSLKPFFWLQHLESSSFISHPRVGAAPILMLRFIAA